MAVTSSWFSGKLLMRDVISARWTRSRWQLLLRGSAQAPYTRRHLYQADALAVIERAAGGMAAWVGQCRTRVVTIVPEADDGADGGDAQAGCGGDRLRTEG